MTTKTTCDTCVFWHDPQPHLSGTCRALPPAVDAASGRGRWPKTYSTDRCAAWKLTKESRYEPCPHCDGVEVKFCRSCRGAGQILKEARHPVPIRRHTP